MSPASLHAERAIPLLMTGGLFVHLVNIANHLRDGGARIGDVLQPIVDAPLALMMVYCAAGLLDWKGFFRRFAITARWRKACYFAIAFYVAASIPGHILFLASGDTRYFDAFPWWFSVVLLPFYSLVILYFVTLRQGPAESGGE